MRGTGSLQQLLGRSTFSSTTRKRKQPTEEGGGQCVDLTVLTEDVSEAVESPLKPQNVRCPVCKHQITKRYGDVYINEHIGWFGYESPLLATSIVIVHT